MGLIINQKVKNLRQAIKSFTRMILIFALVFGPQFSQACTVFAFQLGNDNMIMAKNFDWKDGKGTLIYSPRDVSRESIEEHGESKKFSWQSIWSSFSFHLDNTGQEWTAANTIAKSRFPMGGMNEKGLTIEVVWLVNTKYPEDQNNQGIRLNQLELVRYLLDTKKDIGEVETALNQINLVNRFPEAPLHYMACDLNACIVFEFLDHKLEIFKKDSLIEENKLNNNILTNIFYKKADNDTNPGDFYKGTRRVTPPARFAIVRSALEKTPPPTLLQDALQILKEVIVPNTSLQTQWSYIYEPAKGYLTIPNSQKDKWDLKEYNDKEGKLPIVLKSLSSHNNVGSIN